MINFELYKKFSSADKKVDIEVKAQLEEGKITAIYGKSGAGKTSILRMIAGLIKPDKGELKLTDDIWFHHDKRIHVKTNKRSIGMVFQDFALFPNLTVIENIKYGIGSNENDELLTRVLQVSELSDLLDRYPKSLSGGQQQRVALARAIIRKPKLLLLDEPLSALDTNMRIKLQNEILALQEIIPTTIVLVSHHIPEVYKLADYVIALEDGKISKQGTPDEVFDVDLNSDLIGEYISSDSQDESETIKILVEGKIVSVKVHK